MSTRTSSFAVIRMIPECIVANDIMGGWEPLTGVHGKRKTG